MRAPRRTVGALCGLVVLAAAVAAGPAGGTYALFSDADSVSGRAGAGVWAPDPPAACLPDWHKKHGWHWFMDWEDKAPDHHEDWDDQDWDKNHRDKGSFAGLSFGGPKPKGLKPFHGKAWPKLQTIYGTMGDDVLDGGNWPQIIMGLGGNDVINGGNSLDCLVGGAGDDILNGGNSTDILIGGPGADQLSGGNGIDILIGDAGPDQLNGGNGPDIILAGRNDVVVEREWWDIVIKINELDDCDGSGGLGGILECLLPDVFNQADASLMFLTETTGGDLGLMQDQEDPTKQRSLNTADSLPADEATGEDQLEDTPAPPAPEGPESEPAETADQSETDPPPSTPATPPVSDPGSEGDPAGSGGEESQGTVESESTPGCEDAESTEENCEVKP